LEQHFVQTGAQVGTLALKILDIYNRRGIFSNTKDGVNDMEDILSSRFADPLIEKRYRNITSNVHGKQ
jgi:hypothetical protein